MTNSEYQELVQFLGRKFEEVDRRFDETATKEELRAQQAETRRHFEVVAEGMRGQLQQVAEGLVNLDQKLDRFRQEVGTEFQEVKSMFRFSYAELDRRIASLEQGFATLQERVARMEARQV